MRRTSKHEARETLHGIARSAGAQGRPLDIAYTLAGMGVLAGLGERWTLYRALARSWAVGCILAGE